MVRKPSSQDFKVFEKMLQQMRQELSGDIHHLEQDALGGEGERAATDSMADCGSDSFAQEFSLELLERDEATLGRIHEALERIQAGTYGKCETCGVWIKKERLKAVPYTENCIDCQRQLELEGQ